MGLKGRLAVLIQRCRFAYARFLREAHIPDTDQLYRAIPKVWISQNGEISSGAFDGDEMSVDWGARTTARKSLKRFGRPDAGLASIVVQVARENSQKVKHNPEFLNYAHTLVIGKKTKSIRRKLAVSARWEIPPP